MSEAAPAPNWSAHEVADGYSAFSRESFWPAYHWKAAVALHRSGLMRRPGDVLDVGCGPGWLSVVMQQMAPQRRCVAIDSSREMVRVAAENATAAGLELEVREGDAQALDFPDQSFDLVTSFAVLRLLPDPARALNEAYRVVRRGGLVYFSDVLPSRESDRDALLHAAHPSGRDFVRSALGVALSESEIRGLLEASGVPRWECAVGGVGGLAPGSRGMLEWLKEGFPLRALRGRFPATEWGRLMAEHWIHVYLLKGDGGNA